MTDQTTRLLYKCPELDGYKQGRPEAIVNIDTETNSPNGIICINYRNGLCEERIRSSEVNPEHYEKGSHLYYELQDMLAEKKGMKRKIISGDLKAEDLRALEPEVLREMARQKEEALKKVEENKRCIVALGFQAIK